MQLYAWVSNAFSPRGSPVDHTWVTSYDSRINDLKDIAEVINTKEHYWFCWGSFHRKGRLPDPITTGSPSSPPTCLVGPDNSRFRGTIHWYGIDGVCHQLANQVLYVTSTSAGGKPKVVKDARGYKLSSSLFGTYGRRQKEWSEARKKCGIVPGSINERRAIVSLLSRRMANILQFSVNDPRVVALEQNRRQLLAELDEIGFAPRAINETERDRVDKMNARINSFLRLAGNSFNDDRSFMRMFGIPPQEEIYLIDSDLFEFPSPNDRPERGPILGW